VSRDDAFCGEMRFSNRITDAGAGRLLAPGDAGGPGPGSGDPGDGALRSFVATLRAELPAQPPADGEEILITRLADSARRASLAAAAQATSPIERVRPSRRWRPRLVLFGRVALAAALAPALLAALAFAGVALPEPAQDAFERVGIELPNQAGGDEATTQSGKAGDDEDEDAAAGKKEDGAAETGEPDQAAGAGGAPTGVNGSEGKHKGERKKSGPQGGGPSGGVPPGHGGTPPGEGGGPPGNGGVPPGGGSGGITDPPPSAGPPSTPPGHGGVSPGQAKPK
jgi:hypothetical protein